MRDALDEAGHPDVQIVVSGGFNADRIRAFEAARVPVDAYGVGSALIRGSNDFTADVVVVDGQPCAKVGREHRPNARLSASASRHSGTKRTRSWARALEPLAAAAQQHQPLVAVVDRADEPPAGGELVGERARAPPAIAAATLIAS